MTTFIDGPAAGQHLLLTRAPMLLRVVHQGLKWDALDQLDDIPQPGESIYAYELKGKPGVCFMDFSGPSGGRRGSAYTTATYRFIKDQPTDAELRDTEQWRAWCRRKAGLCGNPPDAPIVIKPPMESRAG